MCAVGASTLQALPDIISPSVTVTDSACTVSICNVELDACTSRTTCSSKKRDDLVKCAY
uniref:Uncharacterized protein n=1 Tax=Hyaloperonospora arabidopsidis (strain Emoy2) TaxID=559515 RepID=M4C1N0_HYAAE